MPLSESDIRPKPIDSALHARGWTEDLIRREEKAGTFGRPTVWNRRRCMPPASDSKTQHDMAWTSPPNRPGPGLAKSDPDPDVFSPDRARRRGLTCRMDWHPTRTLTSLPLCESVEMAAHARQEADP